MHSVENDSSHLVEDEDDGQDEEEVATEGDDESHNEEAVDESILSNDACVEPSTKNATSNYPVYVVPENEKSKTQVVIYHDDSIR